MPNYLYSIDLFAGCGGLTHGMHVAGFTTKVAVELESVAVQSYKLNHPNTCVIHDDIRNVSVNEVRNCLDHKTPHLLAGCPPCQGFSSVRRLNRAESVSDPRNDLVKEYFRFVNELKPMTIMMENVPGLLHYTVFQDIVRRFKELDYYIDVQVVDVKDYGVPQRRKRLVLLGSRLGPIQVAEGSSSKTTVRDTIAHLSKPEEAIDSLQKITARHTERIQRQIFLTPKDGGSRKDLPQEFILPCHRKPGVGFNDIYGRLRWDDYSTTITGGCLNPSKGRFLHPEQDRVITPREAALLQSFPEDYKFPLNIPKQALALLIGNALPPKFSLAQSSHISKHIQQHLSC